MNDEPEISLSEAARAMGRVRTEKKLKAATENAKKASYARFKQNEAKKKWVAKAKKAARQRR